MNYLFTDTLKDIYDSVDSTGEKINIVFESVSADKMDSAGNCNILKLRNEFVIQISIREDKINEDVVSHELLHAFFRKKGFGQIRSNTIPPIPFSNISVLLGSVVEHKLIYELQKNMGIDISKAQKHKANTTFANVYKESPVISYNIIVNALLLLDGIIGAGEYKDSLIDRVHEKFKHTYELAMLLERRLFSSNIDNAIIYREVILKSLKLCDNYLKRHMSQGIPYYKLSENIAISFIPFEHQLTLKAEDVFNFTESINNYIITSKEGNQACYIIEKSNDINAIKKCTVETLMYNIDGLIAVRKDS